MRHGETIVVQASSILDEMGHTKLSGKSYHPPNLHPTALVKNPKAEGAYDYWLRFMEVTNLGMSSRAEGSGQGEYRPGKAFEVPQAHRLDQSR